MPHFFLFRLILYAGRGNPTRTIYHLCFGSMLNQILIDNLVFLILHSFRGPHTHAKKNPEKFKVNAVFREDMPWISVVRQTKLCKILSICYFIITRSGFFSLSTFTEANLQYIWASVLEEKKEQIMHGAGKCWCASDKRFQLNRPACTEIKGHLITL